MSEEPPKPEVRPENMFPLPDYIRKLTIVYDLRTNKIEVSGTVLDKNASFQMLLEAGHIIIGIPVPAAPKSPTNGSTP